MNHTVVITVVIPTLGRESLRLTLHALLAAPGDGAGPAPREIIVVDDRPAPGAPLPLPPSAGPEIRVIRSGGRGPAAARNAGWRAATTPWVAFLDDDVVPEPGWPARLAADLAALPPEAAGSQGRVTVPLPDDRPPTDWERNTAGLADADWITADMAYRHRVLARPRRLRRAVPPRLPGGRRPRAPRAGRRPRAGPRGAAGDPPGPSGRVLGVGAGPGRERRRRPHVARARHVLAYQGR
ncbi:glycosyltransferase [Actinomadura madurae]|uniref:glycosyltransferase family 2 protein n=1 Tax=Actinomadura madurae TaxID=1993 RepID=UPI0020D24350|nr:glycosyltransferase family 2 protein [Actinomadura madurae]MCP9947471.1 glycosyltransferase [Actinomadura madurae]